MKASQYAKGIVAVLAGVAAFLEVPGADWRTGLVFAINAALVVLVPNAPKDPPPKV